MRGRICTITVAVMLMVGLLSSPGEARVSILGIRHWTAPEYTRVVVDTSAEVRYAVTESRGMITVEMADTVLPDSVAREYLLNKPAVTKVIVERRGKHAVRVKLLVADDVKAKVFFLEAIPEKPHRVVIDIKLPAVEAKETEARRNVKTLARKKVVVIDPGHGGEDPGAIGKKGTREKDVVLKIARRLRDELSKKGYQAFLTRDGDYFISLRKRGEIAREYGAELFISIHADASRKRGVRGSSVYCLSTGGASSEAARLLAQNENLSDIIGGAANGDSGEESNHIALDMMQSENLNRSRLFGREILHQLNSVNHLKFNNIQNAPFVVLKLPDIPSVLVETAYISNPREENLLRSASYQAEVAKALASAVLRYAPPSSDSGTAVAKVSPVRTTPTAGSAEASPPVSTRTRQIPPSHHVVTKGDTLAGVARKYGTTVSALMRANGMKSADLIYAGQKLKLTGESVHPRSYVVKKGDTLAAIARKHGTTVQALMKRNRLTSSRIMVGQKLIVS